MPIIVLVLAIKHFAPVFMVVLVKFYHVCLLIDVLPFFHYLYALKSLA